MNLKKTIAGFVFSFVLVQMQAQVNSPDLKCLFVQANGDVTLTWVIPPDPNSQFTSYQIFSSPSYSSGYVPVGSVGVYNQTTFTHIGANANAAPVYYYVLTSYNNGGPQMSAPLDTFSTIYLTVSNSGTPVGQLNYNAISNTLPPSNLGTYSIYNDYPIANNLVNTVSATSYTDTEFVCNRNINFYIINPDNSGCVSRSNVNFALFKDNVVPSTPTVDSVSVDPASNNAELGWNVSNDGDVVGYLVYQWINGQWQLIANVPGHNTTSYINPNSNADVNSEMYCMAAIDSCGNISPLGNNQNTIYATATIDQCFRTATLNWNNYVNWPMGVTGFNIFASYNGGPFNAVGSVGPNTFTFTHTGLVNGNWCYIIRAYGANGYTSSSQKLCLTASLAVAPVFTYVSTATVLNADQVQVDTYVDLAASVQSYRLERADAATGPYTAIATQPYTGSPIITIIDNTAHTTQQSYFYQVVSVDSCGHDAQTSAYSQTIFLQAAANPDRTNTISWNHYQGWLGAVGSYDIYRSIDGSVPVLIGSVNYPVSTYVDDVDPYYTSNGKFTYYVQAHEAAMNIYNLQESAYSNPADCYQQSKFFIPNAFAPHGVNTVFLPLGSYYDKSEYSMLIFDRWGEKLFETEDPTVGWDGTYSGGKCGQGVYVYYIKYKTSIGEFIEEKGTVTLLGR